MLIAAKRRRTDRWTRRVERKRLSHDFAGMIKCVSSAALAGIPDAQVYLANLYQDGVGVPRSLENSALWLERAAANGHLEAMVRLAKLELVGYGPAKKIFCGKQVPNYHRARVWAERAAEAGMPEGKAILAFLFDRNGSSTQAEILRLLEDGAAGGNPSACLQLGIKLLENRDGNYDQARVASLVARAADKELPQALYLLGLIKQLGFGCERDDGRAAALYERSANRGSIYGMARHGAALIARPQETHSLVAGETWLRKAASAGHGAAAAMIGALRAGQDGLPPNFQEAFAWFQEAGRMNDAFGVKAQALLSYLGYGESSEPDVVLVLLSRSRLLAGQPVPDPAYLLAADGVPFAFSIKASEWFAAQAQKGDPKAVLGLASCLAFGMDGKPDHAAARQCLRLGSARFRGPS